eukprot:1271-Heterococcus_DN1.PRE.1
MFSSAGAITAATVFVLCEQAACAVVSNVNVLVLRAAVCKSLQLSKGRVVERLRGYSGGAACYVHTAAIAAARVAYAVGRWGVVSDVVTGGQTLQGEHSGEVTCLAVSHCGTLVATGQRSAKPIVLVWSAATGATVARLQGHHATAVTALAFCPDGR